MLYNICVPAVMSCYCPKCLQTMRLWRNAVTDYCKLHGKETGTYSSANPDWNGSQHSGSFLNRSFFSIHKLCVSVCVCAQTSNSTSTRTYWRVRGWLSKWRIVVISASLMRLS